MLTKVKSGIFIALAAGLLNNAPAETNEIVRVVAETNTAASTVVSVTNATTAVVAEPVVETTEAEADKKRDKFDFIIGGGLVVSSEYGDYIDDVYNPVIYSGDDISGWIDVYMGFEYRPVSRFGILVGSDLWVNGIDIVGGPLDETYFNTIIIPSVYGQLYLFDWLYVNAGINFPIPDTGSDFFEFESDGPGYGVNIGVEIANLLRIEGGYTSVPITAKTTSSNPVLTGEADYDFGGAQVRILLAF